MEHAMSAYHRNLQHGAGLIIISKEFYQFFVDRHACVERFIKMAKAMGVENPTSAQDFVDTLVQFQKDCGVEDQKMSEYGFDRSESMTLFDFELTDEEMQRITELHTG